MFKKRNAPQLEDDSQQHNKVSELRSAIRPLSGHGLVFCSDATLKRHLEARSWNVAKAKQMIEETLNWRSTYKPHEIRWHQVAFEGETGKASRATFHDRQGGVVLILRPGLQNSTSAEGIIKHFVYLLENAILNLPKGQEQMSWLVDFTSWSMAVNYPMKTTREIVYILQNHYPERLGMAFLYNPPRLVQVVYKAIKYFLDTKTAQKVEFVYPKDKTSDELMRTHFEINNLPKEFGGQATLEYNHEDFSRLMCKDDVKTANFWGLEEKQYPEANNYSTTDVVLEPAASLHQELAEK